MGKKMMTDRDQQKSLLTGAAANPRDEVGNRKARAGTPGTRPPVKGAKHLGKHLRRCTAGIMVLVIALFLAATATNATDLNLDNGSHNPAFVKLAKEVLDTAGFQRRRLPSAEAVKDLRDVGTYCLVVGTIVTGLGTTLAVLGSTSGDGLLDMPGNVMQTVGIIVLVLGVSVLVAGIRC